MYEFRITNIYESFIVATKYKRTKNIIRQLLSLIVYQSVTSVIKYGAFNRRVFSILSIIE